MCVVCHRCVLCVTGTCVVCYRCVLCVTGACVCHRRVCCVTGVCVVCHRRVCCVTGMCVVCHRRVCCVSQACVLCVTGVCVPLCTPASLAGQSPRRLRGSPQVPEAGQPARMRRRQPLDGPALPPGLGCSQSEAPRPPPGSLVLFRCCSVSWLLWGLGEVPAPRLPAAGLGAETWTLGNTVGMEQLDGAVAAAPPCMHLDRVLGLGPSGGL